MAEYVGRQFGNYRLVRLLARGGFAEVYLGEHLHLGSQAAVKILHAELTGKEVEGFRNEARTIARLEHPHIVQVLDFGIEDTTPFLVMRYAPNGTLRQRHCSGSKVSPAIIVTYLEQIASALQYAHEQKLIHRDVKPQNMLIGLNEEILLSDFGLAITSQSVSLQSVQNQAGTLTYMAPEQFRGKVCYASDQYALGVVVYEWLCGELPFSEGVLEYQHLFELPAPLHEKDPHISPALEQVVLRALAKDPKDRFPSVQDFAVAIAQASKAAEQNSAPAKVGSTSSPARIDLSSEPLSRAAGTRVPSPLSLPSRNPASQSQGSSAHARLITQPHLSVASPPLSPAAISSLKQSQGTAVAAAPADSPSPVPPVAPQAAPPGAHRRLSKRAALLSIGLALLIVLAGAAYIVHLQTTATSQLLPNSVARTHITATATTGTNPPADSPGAMFGFDPAHTHYNPYERVLSPANVSHLVQHWAARPNCFGPTDNCAISSSPVVSNGVVYIGSDDHRLYAFNTTNGKLLWYAPIGDAIISSPAVANGIVYVGSRDGNVYAFDTSKKGKQLWLGKTGAPIFSSPTVVNGVVYIGSTDDKLYAFEADGCGQTSCQPKWSAPTGGPIGFSSPAVANGVVYIGSDGKLYAFDTSRGKLLWSGITVKGDPIFSSPTVVNGVVYISSTDGRLYAFEANGCGQASCKWRWSVFIGDLADSSPAVANGVVYIGSHDGTLYAFNAINGNSVWSVVPDCRASSCAIDSSPTVANGLIFIGSRDTMLYAFDASSHAQLWSATTGGQIAISSPAVANGVVYIGSRDGTLFAFGLPGK